MLNPDIDRMNFHRSIILAPIVTEKSMNDASEASKYHFRVHVRANKIQIREAVQRLFNVHVLAVNTMNVRGKARRQSQKHRMGTTPVWKKAIVTIAPGERIAEFEIA
jgi:large subunit ribosomal protein L23